MMHIGGEEHGISDQVRVFAAANMIEHFLGVPALAGCRLPEYETSVAPEVPGPPGQVVNTRVPQREAPDSFSLSP